MKEFKSVEAKVKWIYNYYNAGKLGDELVKCYTFFSPSRVYLRLYTTWNISIYIYTHLHAKPNRFLMQTKNKPINTKMSRAPPLMFVILIFVLILLLVGTSSASRPLGVKGEDYTTFKPKIRKEKQGLGVEGCLPKGRRHSSAPSRYINYQPLGEVTCKPMKNEVHKPWIWVGFDA